MNLIHPTGETTNLQSLAPIIIPQGGVALAPSTTKKETKTSHLKQKIGCKVNPRERQCSTWTASEQKGEQLSTEHQCSERFNNFICLDPIWKNDLGLCTQQQPMGPCQKKHFRADTAGLKFRCYWVFLWLRIHENRCLKLHLWHHAKVGKSSCTTGTKSHWLWTAKALKPFQFIHFIFISSNPVPSHSNIFSLLWGGGEVWSMTSRKAAPFLLKSWWDGVEL